MTDIKPPRIQESPNNNPKLDEALALVQEAIAAARAAGPTAMNALASRIKSFMPVLLKAAAGLEKQAQAKLRDEVLTALQNYQPPVVASQEKEVPVEQSAGQTQPPIESEQLIDELSIDLLKFSNLSIDQQLSLSQRLLGSMRIPVPLRYRRGQDLNAEQMNRVPSEEFFVYLANILGSDNQAGSFDLSRAANSFENGWKDIGSRGVEKPVFCEEDLFSDFARRLTRLISDGWWYREGVREKEPSLFAERLLSSMNGAKNYGDYIEKSKPIFELANLILSSQTYTNKRPNPRKTESTLTWLKLPMASSTKETLKFLANHNPGQKNRITNLQTRLAKLPETPSKQELETSLPDRIDNIEEWLDAALSLIESQIAFIERNQKKFGNMPAVITTDEK
ncbi:MAG: hypothetical protein V2A63_01070 [Patescibacteria group bacterium]